jgi:predicted glycoside hydrolase/deacetylase ChbG (UPF0249 family)
MTDDNKIIRGIKKVLANFQDDKARRQFTEQIEKFKILMGKMPTHIDGHYHVHRLPAILPFILEFSKKNKIPVRAIGEVNFIASFSNPNPKNASLVNLIKIIRNLPQGVSELMTHPGYSSVKLKRVSSLSDQRERELAILISPEIKRVIEEEGIKLISWRDVMMI